MVSMIRVPTVRPAWVVLVVAGLLGVGGCGGASTAGPKAGSSPQDTAEQTITVYSGQHDQTAQTIIGTSDSEEYPLGSGVSTGQPLRPLDQLHPPALTADDLGDGRSSLALLPQAGLL